MYPSFQSKKKNEQAAEASVSQVHIYYENISWIKKEYFLSAFPITPSRFVNLR
jgi:hypothetical protein